ncbi:hypothetical protein Zm00014a_016977 [Zea mays]|uniref:Uncharacterized protein n=1 Tax=Zea mays TaxID=4577 RepID=A0A3L6G6V6_MAIZE|nr:hypothetical protein Zm00014a_016977 [Zea mays]
MPLTLIPSTLTAARDPCARTPAGEVLTSARAPNYLIPMMLHHAWSTPNHLAEHTPALEA